MSRAVLLLFAVIGVLVVTAAAQRENLFEGINKDCAENQHWVRCSNCAPTCSYPNGVQPCVRSCATGCKCNEGYVFNDARTCVLLSECEEVNKNSD